MSDLVVYSEHSIALPPAKPKGRNREKVAEMPPLPHAQLQSLVNRLTALIVEKDELSAAIKDLGEEAKSGGFSKKALMALVKRNMESAEQRAERIAIEDEVDRMAVALGMYVDTPLGSVAMRNGAEHQ